MSSDAVFILVSIAIIFAFTGYMIRTMNRKTRLYRELLQLLKDADAKAAQGGPEPVGEATPPSQHIE